MVNSPDYIAFRAPKDLGLLTFVAALVPGDEARFRGPSGTASRHRMASSGRSPEDTSASQSAMP